MPWCAGSSTTSSCVAFQGIGSLEGIVAHSTAKRTMIAVRANMTLHMLSSFEAFMADIADMEGTLLYGISHTPSREDSNIDFC
jgi:hypothetical protein